MLLFGIALIAGGIGVLVKFRDEFRLWPLRDQLRSRPAAAERPAAAARSAAAERPRAIGRAAPPPSSLLRGQSRES